MDPLSLLTRLVALVPPPRYHQVRYSGSLDADLPGLSGVTAVAAGDLHTCALLASGTVHCWGSNYDGQLAGSSLNSPILGLSGVVAIAANGYYTCARMKDLTLRCWGRADALLAAGSIPYKPIVGLTGVGTMAAGYAHACAAFQDGTLHCFGDNTGGQVSGTRGESYIKVPLAP